MSAPTDRDRQQRLHAVERHPGGGEGSDIDEHGTRDEDAQDRQLRLVVGAQRQFPGDGTEPAPAHQDGGEPRSQQTHGERERAEIPQRQRPRERRHHERRKHGIDREADGGDALPASQRRGRRIRCLLP